MRSHTNEVIHPEGVEQFIDSPKEKASERKGGAGGGALSGDSDPIDLDLALLIDRWPTLAAATKTTILAMVQGK